jgi:hypothetical protein
MKRFGPETTLKIRKRNGEVVTLDFPKPNLRKNPDKFYGVTRVEDPLAVKN